MFITVLMFIFSKFFSFMILGEFGPKIWSSLNWLEYDTEGNCYMIISILMFILSKFLSAILFWVNLVPWSEDLQND